MMCTNSCHSSLVFLNALLSIGAADCAVTASTSASGNTVAAESSPSKAFSPEEAKIERGQIDIYSGWFFGIGVNYQYTK